MPNTIFLADLSYLSERINVTLDCSSNRSVNKQRIVAFAYLLLDGLFQLRWNHSSGTVCLNWHYILCTKSTKVNTFLDGVVADIRSEYFHRFVSIQSFFIEIRVKFGSREVDTHEVCKWTSWSHCSIYSLPSNNFPHVLVNGIFHKCVTRWDLVGEHWTIDWRSHNSSDIGILVKASKQLVVEVRMIRFHLVLKHCFTGYKQIFLIAGFVSDLEIYCSF